jgi:hypothetical protein
MTMQHPVHPDDERLAALAGDDSEVAADAALRAHVDACDRCTDVVRDLASLRSALSELPDLVPSRPLQLLPPVPEAKAPARSGWLRRLAAPAMAAGFVLVVVGAVGSSGLSVGQPASAEAPGELTGDVESEDSTSPVPGVVAPTTRSASGASGGPLLGGESSGLDGASPRANRSSDQETASSPSAEAAPPANGGESEGDGLFAPTDPRLPWLVVLALGVGLLLAGIYLRFVQQPRAG